MAFTGLQYGEYCEARFSINDGNYGSSFYLATGFHGAHVIIGSMMLAVSMLRLVRGSFSGAHMVGFDVSA